MNFEQVKGIIERVVTVAVTWAVAKEYIPVGIQTEVVSVVILAASIIWGFWVNTNRSLQNSANVAAASTPSVPKDVAATAVETAKELKAKVE